MKACKRCGEMKPLSEYWRAPRGKDGLMARCKPCHREDMARSYQRHPDRLAERQRRANEWSRVRRRDGRLTPAEKAAVAPIRAEHRRLEQARRYREYQERHREEIAYERAVRRDSRFTPAEQDVVSRGRQNQWRKVWMQNNREKHNAWSRRGWMARHLRMLGNGGHATAAQIAARWAYYGGKCWMCGAPAQETDHVIPINRGGTDWPANQRPACRRCNRAKSDRDPFELMGAVA